MFRRLTESTSLPGPLGPSVFFKSANDCDQCASITIHLGALKPGNVQSGRHVRCSRGSLDGSAFKTLNSPAIDFQQETLVWPVKVYGVPVLVGRSFLFPRRGTWSAKCLDEVFACSKQICSFTRCSIWSGKIFCRNWIGWFCFNSSLVHREKDLALLTRSGRYLHQ